MHRAGRIAAGRPPSGRHRARSAGAADFRRPDCGHRNSRASLRKTAVSSTHRFRIDGLVPAVYEVRVAAPGFALKIETVDLRTAPEATLEIRLETGRITEQVIVTPARSEQRLGDVPASVTVMDSEEIRRSPAVVADDVLRQIPTFSLFRRTSSLSSHPTSQGVSLRGIGPSGTSRTLVLIDDVPFNDPFGGWVYWTRVPLMSVDRMELVDGSTSSLYGNYAMGGVINIVTRQPDAQNGRDQAAVRQQDQPEGRLLRQRPMEQGGGGRRRQPLQHGWISGRRRERARADRQQCHRRLPERHRQVSSTRRPIASARSYAEAISPRTGSTRRSARSTIRRWTTASGGVRIRLPDESTLQARVVRRRPDVPRTFLAVTNAATTRDVVRLATDQTVPAKGVGGMVQWSKTIGASHVFSAGTDWRWVDGDSRTIRSSPPPPPSSSA